MKCGACEYEYEMDYVSPSKDNKRKGYEVVKGDDPFIEVLIQCKTRKYGCFEPDERWLHVCPKCGTVRMEI